MSEERWMKNPFGLRIAILGKEKPLKGAPVGGNSENVVNPRNTLNEEHIIKRDNAGRWNYDYIMKNNLWRNEV